MTERCAECNYKRGHAPTCKLASSADRLEAMRLPTHEGEQHHAAYGDVCGPAVPPERHLHERETLYTGTDCTCELRSDVPGPDHAPSCILVRWPDIHRSPAEVEAIREAAVTFGTGACLTTDKEARKRVPLATGLFDYFPDALAAVAETSYQGSKQHHPDEPVHWERGKSNDHDDCLLRHFLERGTVDTDGIRHSAKVAWRALALLQLEIEKARA